MTVLLHSMVVRAINRMPRFVRNKVGTPSIETVGLIALIALAVFPLLKTLGVTIGNVFNKLTSDMNANLE